MSGGGGKKIKIKIQGCNQLKHIVTFWYSTFRTNIILRTFTTHKETQTVLYHHNLADYVIQSP